MMEVDYLMVNYKQILILAVFGIVNLSVLGTVVSEEKNVVNSGVEMGRLTSDGEAKERSEVMSSDNQPNSEMKDVVEMLEALKIEKAELDKLKSKFKDAEKLAENKREKEKKYKTEGDKKNESEGVLTNHVKEKVENNEKPVNEQNILISPEEEEEKEVEEIITLKNEDKKVQEIENVVENGEEIVHPFKIAENLYKLGEYKLALEIYKLVDKNKIENEREIWVLYQIANCYRKQKLYDEAVKVYRELRDGYEGTYWSKQAQWYIKDIEWRATVEERMVKVIGK